VNAPLFNVPSLATTQMSAACAAIGKMSAPKRRLRPLTAARAMGGVEIFANGVFQLDPTKETSLVAHLKSAELYASAPPKDGVFAPPIDFRPRTMLELENRRSATARRPPRLLGGDLTHEYVSENADYRS